MYEMQALSAIILLCISDMIPIFITFGTPSFLITKVKNISLAFMVSICSAHSYGFPHQKVKLELSEFFVLLFIITKAINVTTMYPISAITDASIPNSPPVIAKDFESKT